MNLPCLVLLYNPRKIPIERLLFLKFVKNTQKLSYNQKELFELVSKFLQICRKLAAI